MATSDTGVVHDQSGWCLVEESISPVIKELLEDRSSDMCSEEFIVATVTDDQEQGDVSSTASDGDAKRYVTNWHV